MANISGASLTQIQQRLRDTPAYHPFDADTFCDWAMEAGDIVTVRRGEESYQSPIHSSHLVWRGKQNMELNASGTKERDAIARVSKQKYARGGYGMRQQKSLYYEFYSEDGYLHSYIQMSESILVTHFDNSLSDLHSEFSQTAERIQSSVWANESLIYSTVEQTATYIKSEVASAESRMGSSIYQTASGIRSDVWAAESLIYSTIEQTASNIRAEVISAESRMGSSIEMAASGIRSDVWAANSTIYSTIEQTASRIDQTVAQQQNDLTELKGRVIVEAGKASLVAEITDNRRIIYYRTMDDFPDVGDPNIICLDTSTGKYYEWKASAHGYVETEPNKVIKASSITTAINEAGDSETHIDSDHIYIGNQKSTTVINGKITADDVTADFIAGKLATLSTLQVNGITSSGSVSFSGTTTLSGSVQIQGSDGNTRNLATGIRTLYKASESEGVVTLQYIDFNGTTHDVTFNKAVATISGSWSDGTLTVSKDPNGSSTYSSVIDSVLANGQVTYANQILTVPVTVRVRNNGGSQSETGYSGTLAVGAGLAYTAGQNSVNVNRGTWNGGQITFSPSAGTGATKSVTLSAGSASWSSNTATVTITDTTANQTAYTVTVTAPLEEREVTITPSTSQSVGTYTPSSGKIGMSQFKVTVNAVSHAITSFDTTAPSGQTYGSYTNNSDGYTLSGSGSTATARIVVKGTWKCDGVSKEGTSYLQSAPTLLYRKGYTDGYDNVHLTGSWDKTTSSLTNNNRITISKTTSGSINSLSYIVSAAASIEYNSTTHKYTARAKAKVDGTQRGDDATAASGTEAYDDGKKAVSVTIGRSGGSTTFNPLPYGGSVTISAYKDGTAVASVVVSSNAEPTVTIARSSGSTSYNPLPAGGSVTLSAYKNGTAVSGQSITVSAPADTARTIVNNSNTSTNLQGTLTAGKYINLKNSTATGGGIVQSWYVPNAWFYAGAKPNTGPAVNEMASNDYYIWIEYHTPNGRVGSPVGNTVWHINVPSSAATLEYVGVDPNRPSDAYILNSDKQPYVITSAKATYWFLIKAMSGSTQLDAKYLGVGTNVSTSGSHNNPIKFTRGAAGTAPNTYTWSAIIGTNVTGSSTEYTFYY